MGVFRQVHAQPGFCMYRDVYFQNFCSLSCFSTRHAHGATNSTHIKRNKPNAVQMYLFVQPGASGLSFPVDCSEATADSATASQVLFRSVSMATMASPASAMLDSAGPHIGAWFAPCFNSASAPGRSGSGNLFQAGRV